MPCCAPFYFLTNCRQTSLLTNGVTGYPAQPGIASELRTVEPLEPFQAACYVNCSLVVAASGSQPREGWLLIDETSLIEICRPRVFGPLISTSAGLQVC